MKRGGGWPAEQATLFGNRELPGFGDVEECPQRRPRELAADGRILALLDRERAPLRTGGGGWPSLHMEIILHIWRSWCSHFCVLASRFVFGFGSGFGVRGSGLPSVA